MIAQCCKCKLVRQGDHWVFNREILEHPEAYEITHTYCQRCADQVRKEMRKRMEDQQCAGK